MLTKLDAAEIAMQAGGVAVIANGKRPDTLARIFDGSRPAQCFCRRRAWRESAAGSPTPREFAGA